MEITCYRDAEYGTETRALPAATYNLAATLLARSASDCVFVPIRSMQYLAILEQDEYVFVDGGRRNWIDIAWRRFHPQARTALNEPVAYEAVYYRPDSAMLMPRLQSEFAAALRQLAGKGRVEGLARVLKFAASPR